MAISTYGQLKTAVDNWLARTDLSSRVPEFIAGGETMLRLDLRIRLMETSSTLTTTASTRTVALPTRFEQLRSIYISGDSGGSLEFMSAPDYWTKFRATTTGRPSVITIEGDNILFGPVPDSAYSVPVNYYQSLAAFSSDTDNNALLTRAPFAYLYASLLHAAPFLGDDPRISLWANLYEDLVDRLQKADAKDRHGPAPLTMKSDIQGLVMSRRSRAGT
jgi:hypothetical protein|tara:strand:+ start:166 stop:822 length:657 start_codon:yes stop_codon:yes gene_type:complete